MKHQLNKIIERQKPSGIRALNQEAAQVDGAISLTIGEPVLETAQRIKDAANQALADHQTKYPPYQGLLVLREKIIEFEKELQNIDYHVDEVIITQGASGALYSALGAVLNPGDEVIIFEPAYVAYYPIVKSFGGKPVLIDTTPMHFQLSYAEIKARITPKTKAIVINSPNNPTGVIYNEASLNALKQIMDEHSLYVISDDVYNQLVFDAGATFLVQDQRYKKQVIYCQSFSKPYAMTGWRVGYMMADQAIIQQAIKFQQYMAAGVAPFIQYGAMQALKEDVKPVVVHYKKHYEAAAKILKEHKIDFVEPQGAFYLFVNISKSKMKSWEFARNLLHTNKVAVVPGAAFSDASDDYVRLSFCVDYEKVVEGTTLFAKYLTSLES
ncbi:MAG: aminotransferase class I/II-fold pyridoxal phosphate-dependent enzyme [Erysipelothrix sp.]|jgi:aspartate/methionine/tyrosine aminotransferase|nr:aminotransferase class I/II-fold pyridoxal phosphate-dependent enzyme [Erysipelothrix sp.]